MDTGAATSVDPQALRAAAQRLDAAADLLYGAMTCHLRKLCTDDPGIRAALDRLAGDVALWQQAARETAAVLRTAADRYGDSEARAVEALR
jgi:hypothetical protein